MPPHDDFPKVNFPADDASKFYVHIMFCEWAYGPFDSATEAGDFIQQRTAEDRYFGCDGISIKHGTDPLDYNTYVKPYLG